MEQQLKRARTHGASLIAVSSPDQQACARLIAGACNETAATVGWDCVRGPHAVRANDERADSAVADICGGMDPAALVDFPSLAVGLLGNMPERLVLVIHNAHRLVADPRAIQALADLRDPCAQRRSTIVLLAPSWQSPIELRDDILTLDDPLPSDEERRRIATEIADAAELKLTDADAETAVRSTRGLSRYAVEQTIALSCEKSGLDPNQLRSRFIAAINATAGLTYEPPRVTLSDVAGLDKFKAFAAALAGGRDVPDLVVRVDEIEKALSGSSGANADTSGVSQGILGALLTWLEERDATGLIALGPPGAGKSMCSVALGSALGCPTATLDVGALKGSLVGQSEAQTRAALAVLGSLARRTIWVATCNSEVALPPELRRRFKLGVWFFDLLSREEREACWRLYLAKYNLDADAERPEDAGWTGAEIKAACETAWRLRVSPRVAAQWIVPVARAAAEQIESLRRNASNRYVAASKPGVYRYPGPIFAREESAPAARRTFVLDDGGN